MITKKELRGEIIALRRELDEETVALASQVICRKIIDTDLYGDATDLCLYMPVNNEVDVMLLAEIAKEEGKRVWIPKVISKGSDGKAGEMVFNRYEGEEKLETGAYDITESTSQEVLKSDENTLIVMPGAVFTPWKDRIGYGGGFYDRYLSEHPQCRTIAVCYDLQIVPEIPAEKFDRKPDYLISETSIYR